MHFAGRHVRRAPRQHRLLPVAAARTAAPRPSASRLSQPSCLSEPNPLSRGALAQRQLQRAFWVERKPVAVWHAVRARRIP